MYTYERLCKHCTYASKFKNLEIPRVNIHMQSYILPFLVEANSFVLGIAFGAVMMLLLLAVIWIVIKL